MRRGDSAPDTIVFFGAFVFWAVILLWSSPARADAVLCYDNIGGYTSCMNGGTCLNNGTIGAACNCTASLYWEGNDCTVSINDCPIEPEDFCCARGTCADQTGGYTCNCAGQRYNGSLCDDPIAICPDAYGACSPPATCVSSLNSSIPYTCNCSNELGPLGPVFNGEFCHLSISYCLVLDPCVANNTLGCSNLAGDYLCHCIEGSGWTGKNCSTETNECDPDPCGPNSLACDDHHLGYVCHCKDGWNGVNCTNNIDDCIGVTCPSGTFCFDQVDAYQCIAPGPCPPIDICEHNTGCQEFNATNGTMIGHNCDCYRFRPDVFGGSEFLIPYHNGQLCENDIDSCEAYGALYYASPCPGGNTCRDRSGGFTCDAAASDGHCENGATQLELLYSYNTEDPETLATPADCLCSGGWHGVNCTLDDDECLFDPCDIGKVCVNMEGTYYCANLPGPCPGNPPCAHDGICNPVFAINGTEVAHDCYCGYYGVPIWGGKRCEVSINSCTAGPNPCPANRTCLYSVGGFDCGCVVDDGHCGSHGRCLGSHHTWLLPYQNYSGNGICICDAGYEGTNCTQDYDACAHHGLFGGCGVHADCMDEPPPSPNRICACHAGYDHNSPGDGTPCDFEINECDPNPCFNEAPCTDLLAGYNCTCKPGFNGTRCEFNINDCTPSSCNGHGTCHDGNNTFTCTCNLGYTGSTCNTNPDNCTVSSCNGHGTCHDGLNTFTCTCNVGYTGPTCAVNPNNCTVNSCSGHGTCHDGLNTFTCGCDSGYTGPTCAVSIGDCYEGYCANDGVCVDGENDATCDCKPGSTGANCEIAVNECTSNPTGNMCAKTHRPCFEAAAEPDRYHGYICGKNATDVNPCQHFTTIFWYYNATDAFVETKCEYGAGNGCAGWTGSLCETDVDECLVNECANGGNCTNGLPTQFICTCAAGWTGPTCEEDINECDANPCEHDGICSEGGTPGTFTCCCVGGWEGPTCSQNHDDCTVGYCLHNGTCVDGIQSKTCDCTGTGWTGTTCQVRSLLYGSDCKQFALTGVAHNERPPRWVFQVLNTVVEDNLCLDIIAPQRAFDVLRTLNAYLYRVPIPRIDYQNTSSDPYLNLFQRFTFTSISTLDLTRPPDNTLDHLRIVRICMDIDTDRASFQLYLKDYQNRVVMCRMFTRQELIPVTAISDSIV